MTKELREKFNTAFPRKRWITTLTMGGIHQLQEDVLAWHEQEIIEAERRMKERCLECVPLGMTYYDDLTQKDYRDGYNQGVDDSRTAISSLK